MEDFAGGEGQKVDYAVAAVQHCLDRLMLLIIRTLALLFNDFTMTISEYSALGTVPIWRK